MTLARTLFAAALVLAGAPALAQEDPRIVEERYTDDAVYALSISPGHASVIELDTTEVVESIVVGDSEGWLVEATASANRVVVKPTPAASRTNMVVLTTKRSYTFTLDAYGGVDVFLMRFNYTEPAGDAAQGAANYRLRGDRSLYPRLITDNGATTSMFWPADTPFPAVFVTTPDGEEVTAPYRAAGDGLVLDGVHERIVLRRGKLEATASRRESRQ